MYEIRNVASVFIVTEIYVNSTMTISMKHKDSGEEASYVELDKVQQDMVYGENKPEYKEVINKESKDNEKEITQKHEKKK